MKKLYSLLIVALLCASVFCCTGHCQALTAKAAQSSVTNSKSTNLTVMDFIRLKKYLIGLYAEIGNADYNGDNKIDSNDLVALKLLLLGLPVNSNKADEVPKLEEDGYYSEVIKP